MTRKQTMRLFTMLLVCIIILNFIAQPKAEAIGGSLALALGGTSAAKAFLAFIMSCVAMGVTYLTIDDAIAAYDHYTENASVSIEDLRYVQQETWTGNYEGIYSEMSDLYTGVKSWLESLFGTLTPGQNSIQNEYIYDNNNAFRLVNLNGYRYFEINGVVDTTYLVSAGNIYDIKITSVQLLSETSTRWNYVIYTSFKSNASAEWSMPYGNERSYSKSEYNGVVETIPTMTIEITTDAPILNPSFSPQNRTFPPAPYLPYINPGNQKVSQSISASGGTMEIYNGTYDQYLDDVVDNATWEDIQGVISGSVPTTTLTETAEGLIIGEATAGIPYPNPDTTAPGEVLTGLGGIMGLLQGITNWIAQLWQLISGIFAIPEGLTLDFSSLRLVNFKDKFPFSIPWDIYRAVAVFAKSPETPDFSIDIETDYLNIDHSINLAPIDLPLRFARYVMTIFFIFYLASKTRDLIKW